VVFRLVKAQLNLDDVCLDKDFPILKVAGHAAIRTLNTL
jgi:hypothetical protein